MKWLLPHGKWWSVGRAGARTRTSPPHFYPGSSLSYRFPTVWHMSQVTWSQKTAFLQLRGWSDHFIASLDFVFHRPQYFVMWNISDVIWIHSFNSSANHTNIRHAKVIFFEILISPMNTTHPIWSLELKPHFSSDENESAAFTNRVHLHWSRMSSSQSASKVANRRTLHPGLGISPRPSNTTQRRVTPSQMMVFSNSNNHPSTDKWQAAAPRRAHWKKGGGQAMVRWGGWCNRDNIPAQLQGLGLAVLRYEDVSQGGQSKAHC